MRWSISGFESHRSSAFLRALIFTRLITAEVRQDRLVRKRPRLTRVYLEDLFQDLFGFGVTLAVDQCVGQEQQAVDVPGLILSASASALPVPARSSFASARAIR